MLIVITGDIGTGKSTCCLKIKDMALRQGLHCGGIITLKSPEGEIIIEDIKSGKTEILASSENKFNGPYTGKYHFNPAGIKFGADAIEKGLTDDILIIDELGQLELRGEGFTVALKLLTTHTNQPVVVIIRKSLLPDFLPLLAPEPAVFELTESNRDELPAVVLASLIATPTAGVPEAPRE
jgi:nucleoside-triphosphatase THEP1